ncbi:MAG: hypothetical protein C4521_11155 [Actinobacteria bacterium]|nr:MAG: hypothetical protein C4521_11155 [Actinomycetota bacterium]
MMAEERMRETRAVPEGEKRMTTEHMAEAPMRGGMFPAWRSRISWGAILAGVFVAIAAQLVLTALGALIGFGTVAVTTVADLATVTTSVGIWTAISAIISLFIGGWVASRVSDSMLSSTGIWHGLVVWAFALVGSIVLGVFGVSGLLGFAANAATALRNLVPTGVAVSPEDLRTAATVATSSAGWFLLGSLLGLAASVLGGWLGSARMSRAEVMRREEEMRMRKAA